MKTVEACDLERGSLCGYGGIKWAVLGFVGGFALCIADSVVCRRAFDEKNRSNFAISSLRAWLNGEFFRNLVDNGAEEDAFEDFRLALTSDDGLDDYGTDEVTIGLISCNSYRVYRRYMPRAAEWWWTCTPRSTESGEDGKDVRSVNSSGALGSVSADSGYGGVRPLCLLRT
ncbi:MAG: DUF6273 domain-containing protein, partial [Clostridia bacterium]